MANLNSGPNTAHVITGITPSGIMCAIELTAQSTGQDALTTSEQFFSGQHDHYLHITFPDVLAEWSLSLTLNVGGIEYQYTLPPVTVLPPGFRFGYDGSGQWDVKLVELSATIQQGSVQGAKNPGVFSDYEYVPQFLMLFWGSELANDGHGGMFNWRRPVEFTSQTPRNYTIHQGTYDYVYLTDSVTGEVYASAISGFEDVIGVVTGASLVNGFALAHVQVQSSVGTALKYFIGTEIKVYIGGSLSYLQGLIGQTRTFQLMMAPSATIPTFYGYSFSGSIY